MKNNALYYEPAEVLIGVREPFNKNTLWIHPHDGITEIKIFNKGWKLISSTEDKGLSNLSLEQVNKMINLLLESVNSKVNKSLGKFNSNSILLLQNQKDLELKIKELEDKFEKLTKRYLNALVKTKMNGK